MSSIRLIAAGGALALAIAMSTPAMAQLLPGVDLPGITDPVGDLLDTVDDLLGPVDPGISGVDIGDDGDVSVSLLGDNGTPLVVDPNSLLGVDVPGVTVTLPGDLTTVIPDLPGIPDSPTLPTFPDIPGIDINVGDGDPPVVNQPPVVILLSDNEPPIVHKDDPDTRIVVVPGLVSRTIVNGTTNSRNGLTSNFGNSSKLRMLLAMLQNRGWLRFAAGNGVCLPPFAVAQVSQMLNRREERQLGDLLAAYSNDIATMRQMMANCRSGPRLQAGDINRAIGVGIGSNGAPVLYVL